MLDAGSRGSSQSHLSWILLAGAALSHACVGCREQGLLSATLVLDAESRGCFQPHLCWMQGAGAALSHTCTGCRVQGLLSATLVLDPWNRDCSQTQEISGSFNFNQIVLEYIKQFNT